MNTFIFWNFDLTLNFEEIVFQNCWYNHFIGLPSPLSLLSTFVNNWLVPSHPFLLTQYVNVLQLIIDTSAIPKEKSHLISCLKRSATYKLTACPYSEFFWSLFFRIWTECGEVLHISSYSFRMRKNTEHKNSEYDKVLRSMSVLGNPFPYWRRVVGAAQIFFH